MNYAYLFPGWSEPAGAAPAGRKRVQMLGGLRALTRDVRRHLLAFIAQSGRESGRLGRLAQSVIRPGLEGKHLAR